MTAIIGNQIGISDYNERYTDLIEELADKGFIDITENRCIEATIKAKLLHRVWQYGALPSRCIPKEYEGIVNDLVAGKILEYSSSLLTPDEADYTNYVFNNAKFSNPLALRNRYDHADGSVDDPNSQAIENDYCHLLALLISLILKINEELSLHTGKGGIEDFVDWPLIGEDQLNAVRNSLSTGENTLPANLG